ncbi:MAG: transposase [Bacteroidota bacterium]
MPQRSRTDGAEDDRLIRRLQTRREIALESLISDERALEFIEDSRWPGAILCPNCGSTDISHLKGGRNSGKRKRYCRDCRFQFTPITRTPYEGERMSPRAIVAANALFDELKGLDLADEVQRLTGVSRQSAARIALLVMDLAAGRRRRRGVAPAVRYGTLAAVGLLLMFLAWWAALDEAGPLRETWYSGGEEQVLVTPRRKNESVALWQARHLSDGDRLKALAPPDSDR